MNKPIHPDIIKKILLTLIKKDYPSVLDVRVKHTFVGKGVCNYQVYVEVDYSDPIRNNSSNFFNYVNDLCQCVISYPHFIEMMGLYKSTHNILF
jgi:hypothetical protein